MTPDVMRILVSQRITDIIIDLARMSGSAEAKIYFGILQDALNALIDSINDELRKTRR